MRTGRLVTTILAVVASAGVSTLVGCSSSPTSAPDAGRVAGWDGANWMGSLADEIGDRPLSRVVIPGTHDAGTFSIPRAGATIATAQGDVGTAQLGTTPDEFEIGTQVTNDLTWTEQLDAGIRYFDFRVVCDPDGMFIVHTFRGEPVGRALGSIAAWMHDHPYEVLLLDVQKNYGCATQRYDIAGRSTLGNDVLTDLVGNAFGTALAPRPPSGDASTTLRSLTAAGTNVVPFLIDTEYALRSTTWWLRDDNELPPGGGMANVWAPIITMPEMYDHLVAEGPRLSARGASQLLLAALTTSPMFPKDVGIANWYRDWRAGTQVGSLRDFVTTHVLPSMPGMIDGAVAAGYSVLSTDFPELGRWPGDRSFAEMVAARNLQPTR